MFNPKFSPKMAGHSIKRCTLFEISLVLKYDINQISQESVHTVSNMIISVSRAAEPFKFFFILASILLGMNILDLKSTYGYL